MSFPHITELVIGPLLSNSAKCFEALGIFCTLNNYMEQEENQVIICWW